jgi:hypothetical protein
MLYASSRDRSVSLPIASVSWSTAVQRRYEPWGKLAQTTISIQQLIEGRTAISMLARWREEVLSMVSVEVLASQGARRAAFLVLRRDEQGRALAGPECNSVDFAGWIFWSTSELDCPISSRWIRDARNSAIYRSPGETIWLVPYARNSSAERLQRVHLP